MAIRKDYPHLGGVGNELTPDIFAKAMDCFISTLLKDVQLPSWLRCPEGKSMVTAPELLERTKAGLVLNLEYKTAFDETLSKVPDGARTHKAPVGVPEGLKGRYPRGGSHWPSGPPGELG